MPIRRLNPVIVTLAGLLLSPLACGQQPAAPPAARPAAPPATPSGPVIAQPQRINFGFVKPEEEVHGSFTLVNPLDRPVTITQAIPTCQCTGVDAAGKVIPARGSLEVRFSMKMSKAPVHKVAAVTIEMREIKQALKVEFEAEVAYTVRATPNFVDALKGKLTGTFELAASDNQPFRVIAVHGGPPSFVGFDPAKDQPRTKYTLRFDFSAPNSVVPKYLVVETDRVDCPLIDLRVRHETTQIKPPCKPAEFRSSFGKVAPGASGEFDLEFEDMGAARVLAVRSLSPAANVELTNQKADGKSVLVTCKVTPRAGHEGLLFFPVEFTLSSGHKYEHVVLGTVR